MCRPLAGPWDFPEQREAQVCAPHCLSINLPTTCLRGSPAWLSGGLAGLLRGFRKDCGVQGLGVGAGRPLSMLGRGSPQQQQRRRALGRKGAPQGRHQHPRRRAGWRAARRRSLWRLHSRFPDRGRCCSDSKSAPEKRMCGRGSSRQQVVSAVRAVQHLCSEDCDTMRQNPSARKQKLNLKVPSFDRKEQLFI